MPFEKFTPTHSRASAANFDAWPFQKLTPACRFLEWWFCGHRDKGLPRVKWRDSKSCGLFVADTTRPKRLA